MHTQEMFLDELPFPLPLPLGLPELGRKVPSEREPLCFFQDSLVGQVLDIKTRVFLKKNE